MSLPRYLIFKEKTLPWGKTITKLASKDIFSSNEAAIVNLRKIASKKASGYHADPSWDETKDTVSLLLDHIEYLYYIKEYN